MSDGLTPHPPPASPDAIRMLGVRIHLVGAASLIEIATRTALARRRAIIAYVNAHGMNLAFDQPRLRRFFNDRADWVFCDGFGVRWGARLAGLRAPERFTPPDWIDRLMAACSQAGLSVYLLGDRPDVVARAADRLARRHPAPHIAGTHHGFFDQSIGSEDNARVVEAINRATPDVLLVGFGMPAQEYWLADHWPALQVGVAITVGALFGHVAGDVRRAPRWMTDHGLEWAGRLIAEPRRLWRRYLVGNPLFLSRIVRERLGLLRIE